MDIVNLSEAEPEWNWLHRLVTGPEPLHWRHASTRDVALPGWMPKPQTARRVMSASRAAAWLKPASSLLVSHGPRMAMYGSLALSARARPRRHLAYAFNFTDLPTGALRSAMRVAYRQVDRFVCFSTMERELYADFFDRDIARFDMIHWAMRPPSADPVTDPMLPEAYVCAVGSQARDYRTLMSAMRRLPHIALVVVATPQSLQGLELPPNVTVRLNLPLAQTMGILQRASFSVVPLVGSEVPCGHVTLVAAMHLRKANLVSRSTGIADYVEDGVNGLTVAPNDPDALAQAIQRLWDDAGLNTRLADAAAAFAAAKCGEQAAVDYFERYLRR